MYAHTQHTLMPQSYLCICRLQEQKCYSVGRYCVDVKSFESVAIPTLDLEKLKSESKPANYHVVVVVDEIGKMELFSRTFIDQVCTFPMYIYTAIACMCVYMCLCV